MKTVSLQEVDRLCKASLEADRKLEIARQKSAKALLRYQEAFDRVRIPALAPSSS